MCASKKAPLRALSLSREEAQHACLQRLRGAPLRLESPHAIWKPTAPATRPFPSVNGRALTCQPRPPTGSRNSRVRTRDSATARFPSGGCAARALAKFARRAALVRVGPYLKKDYCASETALSLGARPRSDMPAAASNGQLTFACAQEKKRHCARALSLSGGSAARSLAACARHVALVGAGPCPMPYQSSLLQRDGHLTQGTAVL